MGLVKFMRSGATVQHCMGVTLIMLLKLKFVSGLDFAFFFQPNFFRTTLRFQVLCLLILPCHLLIN